MIPKCPCGSPVRAARMWHKTQDCHDCIYHPNALPACVTCRTVGQIYEYLEQKGNDSDRA